MRNTKISYCDQTENPIVGCRHTCPYCYARAIAHRFAGCDALPEGFLNTGIVYLEKPLMVTRGMKTMVAPYPADFTPTMHAYRLPELSTCKEGRTVFVCSMADMMGAWVPDDWIVKVFEACDRSKARFLFLTKNPSRYYKLAEAGDLPYRHWYGTTLTGTNPLQPFHKPGFHSWISYEPMLGPLVEDELEELAEATDWIVMGAETGSNRQGKVVPERKWAEDVVRLFQAHGKPVFMKESMQHVWRDTLITQRPWDKGECAL